MDAPGDDRGEELPEDPAGDRLLDDALHELNRWVAETQVDDAIELRRRAGWLRRQSEDEATLAGTLRDLAEHHRPVVVHLVNGRRHRGEITGVGRDVVELRSSVGDRVVVALDALESVRSQPDATGVTGDGDVPTGRSLVECVARLAEHRTRALVVTRSGEATNGEIVATGRDLITVALDGGGVVYVSLAAVAEVSGPESG